jgi:hypothetical protein
LSTVGQANCLALLLFATRKTYWRETIGDTLADYIDNMHSEEEFLLFVENVGMMVGKLRIEIYSVEEEFNKRCLQLSFLK